MGGTEALHRAGRAGVTALRHRVTDPGATPTPGPHPRLSPGRRPSLAGDRTGPRRLSPRTDVQLRCAPGRLGNRSGGPGAAGLGGSPRDGRGPPRPETRQPPAQVPRRRAPTLARGRLRHRHLADCLHDRHRRRHRYPRLPRPGVPGRHPTLPGNGPVRRRRAGGGTVVRTTASALQQRVPGHAVVVDPHRAVAGRGPRPTGGRPDPDGRPRPGPPLHRLHAGKGGATPRRPTEFPNRPHGGHARPTRVCATGLDHRRPGSPHHPPPPGPDGTRTTPVHTPNRRRPNRAGLRSPGHTPGDRGRRARPKWLSH
jgi:hypothetical protein